MTESAFERRLREVREKKSAQNPVPVPQPPQIPSQDVPTIGYDRSNQDQAIDQLIESIDIVEAYNRYVKKMHADARGRTEGIKVSCPNPAHPDSNPSAWLNTQKGTWYCGPCEEGGDVYDFAAWHYGYSVPGYKSGPEFGQLRKDIAGDYGLKVIDSPTGIIVTKGEPAIAPPPIPQAPVASDAYESPSEDVEDDDDEIILDVELDWRSVLKHSGGDTFLDIWMERTSVDDATEEYHFWNGLTALGLAVGRNVTAWDSIPVYANLFICIIGHSGQGKSKSKSHLNKLITRALPFDYNDPFTSGVKVITTPSSGEVLVDMFNMPVYDPNNPKAKVSDNPVRGIIDFNELSGLTSRSNRAGSVIAPTLMAFFDCEDTIGVSSRMHGTVQAHQAFASVSTTTQNKSLRRLLTSEHVDSGFLNRWLFVAGKPKTRVAVGGAQVDVTDCIQPLTDIHLWGGSPITLTWDEDALDLYTNFFYSHVNPIQQADESGLLNRLDLIAKKLVLLFSINMMTDSITVSAVRQMMDCWEYILKCYSVPGTQIGSTEEIEIRREIETRVREFTKAKGYGITGRELRRSLAHKKWADKMIIDTLTQLVKFDVLETEVWPPRGPGRKTTRYKYVD